jgi:adenylyltransferase/sulfurtransferase
MAFLFNYLVSSMIVSKKQLFKRQITLSEIGKVGQQKLQEASVLIVGCGGLGGVIGVSLAASGIGNIHLVDFDTIDISNLHRQFFYALDDVGKHKAEVLSEFIKKRAPFSEVTFNNDSITKENVFDIISEYDVIVDSTDSIPTKYLLNDACVLKNKPLVYGSLYKFDGYVSTFNILKKDGSYSSNLRDAFPEIISDIPNCEEAGTLNSIVTIIAAQQVNEVLKLVAEIGTPLTDELLIYNSLQNTQLKIKLTSNFLKDRIAKLYKVETYFNPACVSQNIDWLISAVELKKIIGDSNLQLIAVLPNLKVPFKVDQTISIEEFDVATFFVDKSKTYVMICQKGFTSYNVTKQLKEKYPTLNVLSLTGGISSY